MLTPFLFFSFCSDHKDVGSVDITKEFRQVTDGLMTVGFSLTLGVAVYYHLF